MDFERQIARRLHEEHVATLEIWSRVEQTVGKRDAALDALIARAAAALADEVARHFDFEEKELFPRLAQAGEGDIAELLAEEHGVIRGAAAQFDELARQLRAGSLDAAGWQRLRVAALELAERLVAHVQKEEMSLLPALEDLLDEATDAELALTYSG
ncbi:MAG TPA: hemerythrin domain-containing protein [Burkholderiales bacterium]|nr:hemerythrin domain-containing protein [Burkholderiales bacterium]